MRKNIQKKIISLLVMANGALCILYAEHIYNFLSTICAFVLLYIGIAKCVSGIRSKDYRRLGAQDFEVSIVLMAVGTGIMIRQDKALFIVGVFWGLWGLYKAVDAFDAAFYGIFHKSRFMPELIAGLFQLVLSLLLLFDPENNMEHHIIILGLELILEGILEIVERPLFKDPEE